MLQIDDWHMNALITCHVVSKLASCGGFEAQVKFNVRNLRELIDRGHQSQATQIGGHPFQNARQCIEQGGIRLHPAPDTRPQQLDGNLPSVMHLGIMNLCDGSCGYGFWVKAAKQGVDRLAGFLFDLAACLIGMKGRQPILKLCQRMCHLWANQIGTCGQGLAKFNEAGAKANERFCKCTSRIPAGGARSHQPIDHATELTHPSRK